MVASPWALLPSRTMPEELLAFPLLAAAACSLFPGTMGSAAAIPVLKKQMCVFVFGGVPDPSEAPSLVLWLTFTRVQHCTVQQLGWERGTPLLPIQLQARPLARCSAAGRPTALLTAAATSASWHQSSCAALLAILIYLPSLINELNKPTSLLALPLVLQVLPAPNTRGGQEA